MKTARKIAAMNDSIWDDGEWVSWDEINQQIQDKEWRAKYPNADILLIPIFEQLISVAEYYYNTTGSHLQVTAILGSCMALSLKGSNCIRIMPKGQMGA